jgi:predicted nucleotidyltransferase
MRLSASEIEAIKQTTLEVFGPNARVTLFGSRARDDGKGGDIDLYIASPSGQDFDHKVRFLLALDERLGEQKVDVIYAENPNRPVERQAILTGIPL